MWLQARWADGQLRPSKGLELSRDHGGRQKKPSLRCAGARLPGTWWLEGGFEELSPTSLAWLQPKCPSLRRPLLQRPWGWPTRPCAHLVTAIWWPCFLYWSHVLGSLPTQTSLANTADGGFRDSGTVLLSLLIQAFPPACCHNIHQRSWDSWIR